jgi:hypothetical protein
MPADTLAPIVDANTLRALAEAVDGMRNTDACIVADPGDAKRPYKVVKDSDDGRMGRDVIMRVRTGDRPEVKTRDHGLTLSSVPPVKLKKNGPAQPSGEAKQQAEEEEKGALAACDAIFTSLSAIDKFVVPYYAKLMSLPEVEQMRTEFAEQGSILAAVHLPDSEPDSLVASGGILKVMSIGTWLNVATPEVILVPFHTTGAAAAATAREPTPSPAPAGAA